MKRILAGTVLMVMALPCYGAGENIPTSRAYVDSALSLKQAKFPAANSGLGSGTSVLTYTATSGTIGERALYTDASSYDASNDADKLITASALNGAVTSLQTDTTTKLVCANPGTCDLWNIVDQTAYAGGSSSGGGTTLEQCVFSGLSDYMPAQEYYRDSTCSKLLNGNSVGNSICSADVFNSLSYGEWAVQLVDKETENTTVYVQGTSTCSSVEPSAVSQWVLSFDQSQLQQDYALNLSNAPTSSLVGSYCHCKITNVIGTGCTAPWVSYDYEAYYSAVDCAGNCANDCAYQVYNKINNGESLSPYQYD